MKYVPSPLIGRLSKSAGSVTAAYNRFGSYLRNRVTPTNPNTSFQTNVRANFGDLASAWRGLTAATQLGWTTLGENMTRQDSLGQTYSLTGLQAFISVNTNLLNAGQSIITNAPALQLPDAVPTFSVAMGAAGGTAALTFTPPGGDEWYLIFATRPVSDGRQFASRSEFKLIDVLDETATSPDALGPEYIARFGAITGKAGEKVFWRIIRVSAFGFASTHVQESSIIGA